MPAEIDTVARRRIVTRGDPVASAEAGRRLAGIDHLRAMMAGDLAPPPIMELLGIDLVSIEPGTIRMAIVPGEHLYNPIGMVHGGVAATILDSVMGCAVHSLLSVGRGYSTLEIKVNYARAVTERTGRVVAEGRVRHLGRQTAIADATLVDEAGRLHATASTTCLVFDVPGAAA